MTDLRAATRSDRDEIAKGLRETGASLQNIGDAFGVSRERARQLAERAGFSGKHSRPTLDPIGVVRAARSSGVQTLGAALRVMGKSGSHSPTARRYLEELNVWEAVQRLWRWRRDYQRRERERRCIGKLRAFYESHGRSPSSAELGTGRRGARRLPELPSDMEVLTLFGNRRAAFQRAGIPLPIRPGRPRRSAQLLPEPNAVSAGTIAAAAPTLRAPFPWFGGKRRIAPLVWSRFGDVPNYIEPFAGSLAVLLGRPTAPRVETVNDKDAYLANFWRAIQAAPDDVAQYAAWPVNEADLNARHQWLVTTGKERVARLLTDPDFFDAKVAGWWVWGLSLLIGDGWCAKPEWRGRANAARDARGIHKRAEIKRPAIASGNGQGSGVHRGSLWEKKPAQQQRFDERDAESVHVHRKRPALSGTGTGVRARILTQTMPALDGRGGRGVTSPRTAPGLFDYFGALADRLRRVRVCVGDWARVVGPAVTSCIGLTGILLDPPYHGLEDGGRDRVYTHDDGEIWNQVKDWAVANGDDPALRIALCGHEGDHAIPDTWECVKWKGPAGYARAKSRIANRHRERVWFSPHCLHQSQQELAL